MIREGGLSPSDVFDGVRLRVNEATKGAQVPWNTSRIASPFVFFERAADAPPPAFAADRVNAMQSRPLRDLGAQDAYAAAIERDTLEGYESFLGAYPTDPLANRVRALLAARREAITWQKTWQVNTPDACWSYLDRYPRGPHAAEARQRLAALAAPEEPPPSYAPISYDVPPPPPPEIVYVDRPVLVFDDPAFGFVPPPPIVFLAPPPVYLASFFLLPPPVPIGLFVLPFPVFVPVPVCSWRLPFLQAGSSDMVELFFRMAGVPYLRQGFVFELPGVAIRVAEECSGIRSSLALLITTVLASHFFLRTNWKRMLLCAVVVPIVIFKNGLRIATLSVLAIYVNPGFLYGRLHHQGGVVFFLIALLPMALVLLLLQKSENKKSVPSTTARPPIAAITPLKDGE